MPQIVYNEVDTLDAEGYMWSILAESKQVKTGSTFTNNPEFEEVPTFVKIADFDTFLSFNGKHESQVVQNAIEQGQFRSVNKIRKPNTCTVELGKGGDVQDIQLVLDNLKKYKDSTDLLVVYTPFGILENMNLISLDYSFKYGSFVNMLIVKLTLQEIQTGGLALEFTTAMVKNPQDTNTKDVGEKAKKEVTK